MKKINLKDKGFKEICLLLIILVSMSLSMNSPSLAQSQNEKPKEAQLNPQEQFSAMHQWQKENFECMVDFGNNILNSIAPNGIVFIYGDAPTFALYYLLKEKKLRPDVEVYDYNGNFFKLPVEIKLMDNIEARKKAERDIILGTKRPIFFIAARDMNDLPECKIKPCGMVYQILRPEDKLPDYKNILSKMIDLNDYLWKSPTHDTREIVSNYLYSIGLTYSELGEKAKYADLIRRSAQIGFDIKRANFNVGNAFVNAESKDSIEEAIFYYLAEIQCQPKDQLTYVWLAYAYDRNGEKEKAISVCRKAIAIDPSNPKPYFSFAYYLGKLGQDNDAIQEYQKGLALDSTYGEAYYYLGLIYEKKQNNRDAVAYYEKSIQYLTDTTHKADARNRLQKLKLK